MLSIIIPIYNSELYLKECLDSLVSQTCKEFEVILVDDGSTDCSVKLCDLYCSVYSNFRYFYQSNEGPSAARNTGLKHVTGEFISFIDSDDYVANDYVETILGNMIYFSSVYYYNKTRVYLNCLLLMIQAKQRYLNCL